MEERVELRVPPARLSRWLDNFASRHGAATLSLHDGTLCGRAPDGSAFRARPPFGHRVRSAAVSGLVTACEPPPDWGLLLVRKGGFAVARMAGAVMVEHKIGQRHVQGRTKAGGQSQQRFARRRQNQARDAYRAAAEHAVRILSPAHTLVVGGDHQAVEAVLADPRLAHCAPTGDFLTVPDPRRAVLDRAIQDACSVRMSVVNTDQEAR